MDLDEPAPSDPNGDPIGEVAGAFVDEMVAEQVAAALNQWFRWILDGSEAPVPELFESFGVETADYAWTLGEDVDWSLGPHARAVGDQLRISIQTHDTHLRLSGLLRALGALRVWVERDTD